MNALQVLEPDHIGERVDRCLQPIFPQPCALALGDPRQEIGEMKPCKLQPAIQPDIIDRIVVLAHQLI